MKKRSDTQAQASWTVKRTVVEEYHVVATDRTAAFNAVNDCEEPYSVTVIKETARKNCFIRRRKFETTKL